MNTKMENKKANYSIECSVERCANHCQNANYCSLDKITVGTHEANPTEKACTDCNSFVDGMNMK